MRNTLCTQEYICREKGWRGTEGRDRGERKRERGGGKERAREKGKENEGEIVGEREGEGEGEKPHVLRDVIIVV